MSTAQCLTCGVELTPLDELDQCDACTRHATQDTDAREPYDKPPTPSKLADHASALADALSDVLEELDPDGEEHPEPLGVLQRYRLYQLERAGQQALALDDLDACAQMLAGEDPDDPEACLEDTTPTRTSALLDTITRYARDRRDALDTLDGLTQAADLIEHWASVINNIQEKTA